MLLTLFASEQKLEVIAVTFLINEFIAGLFGESGKIADGTGIGGDNPQNLVGLHFSQRLLGTQNGERATQSRNIKFSVE